MRRWMLGLAFASGCTLVFALGASAQVAKVQAQEIKVAPIQVQAAPAQVQVQIQVVPGGQIQIAPAPVQIQVQVQAQPVQIAQPALARPIMFNQPPRLVQADAVVVGRVIALEPMDVETPVAAGQANVNYRVAVVQVSEALHGVKKDVKMVRVGFIAQPMNNNPGGPQVIQVFPGGGKRIMRPYGGSVSLQVGQDGLFTLAKHHKESFFVLPNFNSFVTSQNNTNFDNEVKNAKQLCKVLENTGAALKSTEKEERILAAAVLISKYRSNPSGQATKQEPIDAEESKLILKALAEGNFNQGQVNGAVPGATELFNMLGLTQADGYKLGDVRNQQDITDTMQRWLTDNSGKYRIKKLVADPNAKAQPAANQPGVAEPGVVLPGERPGFRPRPIQIQPQVLPTPPAPPQPQPKN